MSPSDRNGPAARGVATLLVVAFAVLGAACKKGAAPLAGSAPAPGGAAPKRGEALFLAEAPAVVPEEVEPDLDAMGIGRLYVAAASLSVSGKINAFPPPPSRIARPVVLVVMGDKGAAGQISGTNGELLGEAWATSVRKVVAEAKTWANVVGVHFHFLPAPEQAPVLAAALKAVRRVTSLPVSVTLPPSKRAEAWKPLSGSADEALVFSLGRRPETEDQMIFGLSEEAARAFPIPFRLLVVPGGYGRAGNGSSFNGRVIPDGQIDALSEDRNLDFDFGQVLSTEPGNLYNFKPHASGEASRSLLAADGGYARFQVLTLGDVVKHLSTASRWAAPNLLGRVFLVDGVPMDGHILGFPAIRAFLTGKSLDPKLEVETKPESYGKGWAEFSLRVTNAAPAPTELSHYNNWIQVRLEAGVFTFVKAGEFDRYELLSSAEEGARPAPFGRAVICRLFENIFVPGESNSAGPIRVSGVRPRAFVSYRLTLADGRTLDGPEAEVDLTPPTPTPRPKAPPKAPKAPPKKR